VVDILGIVFVCAKTPPTQPGRRDEVNMNVGIDNSKWYSPLWWRHLESKVRGRSKGQGLPIYQEWTYHGLRLRDWHWNLFWL